jgi:hypothetical protein
VTVDGEVALTGAENDISMNSQILIDGILGGGQVGQFYSPDDNDIGRFETEGHHSGRCGLGVGNHSVVWRFAASQASSTAFVRGRTMTSQFKK